ncbi:pituitary homeobox x-like [Lineus longissimus]|uniref:pituitary homeobox x-like n=1 Tax=Lineus longissimus TaxID=88925 RepID=UPI00315DE0F3
MPSSNESVVTYLQAPQFDANRQRRSRTKFSPYACARLETAYETNHYPGISEREELARVTGVAEDRVHVWFQNRRRRVVPKLSFQDRKRLLASKVLRPQQHADAIGAKRLLDDEFRHGPAKDEHAEKKPSPHVDEHCKKKLKRTTAPPESIRQENATPSLSTTDTIPSLPMSDFAGTSFFGTLLSTMPFTYACPRGSVMVPMLPPIPDAMTNPVAFRAPSAMSSVPRVRKHPVPAQQSSCQSLLPKLGRPRKRNVRPTPPTDVFSSRATQTTEDLHRLFGLLDKFAAHRRPVPRQPTRATRGLDLSTHQRREPQLRHPFVKVTCEVSSDSTSRLLDDSLGSHDPVSPISGVYPLHADADSNETEQEGSCDADDEYIDVCN